MAVVFMEGFDTKSALGWSEEPFAYVAGRMTGEAAHLSAQTLTRSFAGGPTTASVGFGISLDALQGGGYSAFIFNSSVWGALLSLQISNANINVIHGNGSSNLQTYSVPGITLTTGTWGYFEISLVWAASGSVTIKYNGNTMYTYTGDTRNNTFTAATITDIKFASPNATAKIRVDDVYLTNTSTALGDCIVQTMVPTSDSTPSAWTPSTGTAHYAVVDEIPHTYTDYLSTVAGDNLDDTYKVTVPAALTGNSLAVEVRAHALKTDAGAAAVAMLADGQASSAIGVPVVNGLVSAVFETAAAGAVWTPAKLASASFGVRDAT